MPAGTSPPAPSRETSRQRRNSQRFYQSAGGRRDGCPKHDGGFQCRRPERGECGTGATRGQRGHCSQHTGTIVKTRRLWQFSAGAITATSLSGDGSGLNNLNGSSIAGGTVTSAQLAPGAALTNLTASGQSGVPSGALVLGNAKQCRRMIAAGYTSVGPIYVGEDVVADSHRRPAPISGPGTYRRLDGKELIIVGAATMAAPT